MYLCLIALILSEILYFRTSRIYNKFEPDADFDDKLKITVDMTVAMRCHGTYRPSTLHFHERSLKLYYCQQT